MKIDSHFHLVDRGWVHDDFFIGMARVVLAGATKLTGDRADPVPVVENLLPVLADTTGEKLVANMDATGVDMTCVFALDYGLLTGEPGVPIEEQNRKVGEAAGRFPDRLTGFFTIDPRRPGALEMFRRGIEEWGLKGLKLHPCSGYYPYQEECYPLYEACMEYGVPVLFHTGSQPAPLKSRFARPEYVDDVAADFPDLPIIMAHVGSGWWTEALLVAGMKPNVYFDFSAWQITFNEHPEEFYRMLRRIIDDVGPWRVFFGTDGPYLNVVCPLDRWVAAVMEPDLSVCPEVFFSDEEKRIIMGDAFARLMGLGG
jgi:predicted TIM-barrel fold metal-dependent hydrolase